jgi:hypothetical protein
MPTGNDMLREMLTTNASTLMAEGVITEAELPAIVALIVACCPDVKPSMTGSRIRQRARRLTTAVPN